MASVAIVGGTEETRLLLRGLLRLYRHRVVGEGPTFSTVRWTAGADPPSAAVVDFDLDDAEAVAALRVAKREHPSMRVLLLTPSRTASVEARAREVGVDALVRRPFAVHELMEALELSTVTRHA